MTSPTNTTAMAHAIDGEDANFEVHFLHSDNPRDGFHVMSVNPLVHYEFRTPIGFLSTHTIVRFGIHPPPFPLSFPPSYPPLHRSSSARLTADYQNHHQVTDVNGATVITFNWFGPSALGTMTWPGPPEWEAHMGDLVHPSQSMPQ